ncbi:DUF4397 domain-containing protein [Modestobacter sp. VKM Ac-2983]|uniref:DUF4397 domain-containing protein n=1 Tax=Modestobacter sp. VKM Ac-2983 TaxID=3004137 RepID=UPI0022AB7CB8|nr:DUF4397 domain-containing protein [Modestobacter sp. VKM Ac-2983]MCZ2803501.1 DUF4397 domain-containing protein [Modestobacter sp. VKM Ac-2983]
MNKTRPIALTAGATGAFALLFAATPALADSHTATLSVLHAIPETPVDVYANGERLIDDFEPGTLAGPLTLPAGDYDLALYPADAEDASGEPLLQAMDVAVPAGANATVAAHLTEAGEPALTPFVNDTSAVPAGEGRLTVRHVAAAPAVDVRAGGEVVIDGLVNPNEESLTVPAGNVSADVVLAGTDTVAIGPADLTVAEGANTIVYAWGSADAGYELATQTVQAGASAPTGVPGGSAGLAADEGMPAPLVGLTVAGLAAAAFAGRKYATSRV